MYYRGAAAAVVVFDITNTVGGSWLTGLDRTLHCTPDWWARKLLHALFWSCPCRTRTCEQRDGWTSFRDKVYISFRHFYIFQ
jgi:GTPase SAR1 family protein